MSLSCTYTEQVRLHTEQVQLHTEQVRLHTEQVRLHTEQVRLHNEQVRFHTCEVQLLESCNWYFRSDSRADIDNKCVTDLYYTFRPGVVRIISVELYVYGNSSEGPSLFLHIGNNEPRCHSNLLRMED